MIAKPPTTPDLSAFTPSVFLAGSIEQDKAENWQTIAENFFMQYPEVVVLNPRRDSWDSSVKQTAQDARLHQQVSWELYHLSECKCIIMYFDPTTLSPITLLELGLYAKSNKLLVCCPDGFWRKGNVEIVCARYNVPMFNTLLEMLQEAASRTSRMGLLNQLSMKPPELGPEHAAYVYFQITKLKLKPTSTSLGTHVGSDIYELAGKTYQVDYILSEPEPYCSITRLTSC